MYLLMLLFVFVIFFCLSDSLFSFIPFIDLVIEIIFASFYLFYLLLYSSSSSPCIYSHVFFGFCACFCFLLCLCLLFICFCYCLLISFFYFLNTIRWVAMEKFPSSFLGFCPLPNWPIPPATKKQVVSAQVRRNFCRILSCLFFFYFLHLLL